MKLKSLNSKRKPSISQAIDKQMEEDIKLDENICPVCNSKLTTYWNVQQTHKYEVCTNDESHHKRTVDYVKDDD